ncbi:MAG: fec operon regulator FecR [Verrucomicrobia bacterium]|nr:fec operon regulator FecR [Verrucomicrobiota bacterium]
MNPTSTTFNPADEEQASLWAARLDSGAPLSSTDRVALDAWLAGAPAHRELLSSYCQFSADLERKLTVIAEASSLDLPASSARRGSHWGRWAAVTTLAAAAAIAFVTLRSPAQDFPRDVVTPVGHRQSLTLADGTRVDLNAQTNLRIDISGERRHVLLASGEAFFAVHKDPSRPFIVETPAGSVRVTGTQFSVRTETTSALEVTVLEGSVRAHPVALNGVPSAPHALSAGDQLSASPSGVKVNHLSSAGVEDALAWRQGEVVFDHAPLRLAVARFARYHGRGITVAPDVAEIAIGGRYKLDDLDDFLAYLEEYLHLRVSHEPNGTVRVTARTEK